MLFVGDIAIPNNIEFKLGEEVTSIDEVSVGNLEGLIVPEDSKYSLDYKVYNSDNTVRYLKSMNIKAVTLANNHVCDVPEAFEYTKKILKENDIQFFGAGMTDEEAKQPTIICEGGGGGIHPRWIRLECNRLQANKARFSWS